MRASAIIFSLALSVLAASTQAQDANRASTQALQKAQFMLRQAASEKAELQAQLAALQQQADKLAAELAAVKTASDQSKRATEEKYGGAIAQWKQRDAQNAEEAAALKQQLKAQGEQSKLLEAQLQQQTQNFSACYENNKKLYDINAQLLTRYENKGFADVLKQREPFTGVSRVEIENIVQDYRYQLDDLRVQPDQAAVTGKDDAEHKSN